METEGAAVMCNERLFHRWAATTGNRSVADGKQPSVSNVQIHWCSRMQIA